MDIAGTPYAWLAFDERGILIDPGAQAGLAALLTPSVTNLVVISHGWKTDKTDAMALYEPLWKSVLAALTAQVGRAAGGFVVAGVQWPSKEFRTDFDSPAQAAQFGALALSNSVAGNGDLSPAAFNEVLGDAVVLAGAGGPAVYAAAAAMQDGFGPGRAQILAAALKSAFPQRITNADIELRTDRAPLVEEDPQELLLDLMAPPPMTLNSSVGSAMGLGSLVGQTLAGPRAAVGRLLNQFTYYEMKARAGDVGAALGARVLSGLAPAQPVRLHLIGHSFGGRLVTAAAAALAPPSRMTLQSLTLLQAAFSHNALSADVGDGQPGAFPKVIGKVAGPISATHTHNDLACTLAYALASRLVRDNAMAIGDSADQFGAIGANGMLHLAAQQLAAEQAMSPAAAYRFMPGHAHNFNADLCIAGHMDVTNPEVGRLVAAALSH